MRGPALATACLAALLAGPSCRSSSPDSLEAAYRASRDDLGRGSEADLEAAEVRRRERVAFVHARLEQGPLAPRDALYAAAVLLDSDAFEDLALAEELALQAAEAGDDRGFPLAAEAIDRQLLVLGQPQRYGTQYVWSPDTERWALYPCDPATTDAERQAMGVPPLAEARARAASHD